MTIVLHVYQNLKFLKLYMKITIKIYNHISTDLCEYPDTCSNRGNCTFLASKAKLYNCACDFPFYGGMCEKSFKAFSNKQYFIT